MVLGTLAEAGEGIMSGFEARRRAVPVAPTKDERRKPGLDRSMRYQRTGLTRASVREAWRVDAHGSLRCENSLLVYQPFLWHRNRGQSAGEMVGTRRHTIA